LIQKGTESYRGVDETCFRAILRRGVGMICDPSRLDQLVELGRRNLANQPSVLWAEPSPTASSRMQPRYLSALRLRLRVFSSRLETCPATCSLQRCFSYLGWRSEFSLWWN